MLPASAVIDDDEIADPDWLERMCAAAETLRRRHRRRPAGAGVSRQQRHARFAGHPVFAPPYRESGPVAALYSSGNLLIGRHVLAAMGPPFLDLQLQFHGRRRFRFPEPGGAKGFKLAWCAEAQVRETVPARRLEADWIRSRSLRNGVISTLVEKKKRAGLAGRQSARLRQEPGAACRLAVARPGEAGANRLAVDAIYPVYVALGRVLAEFGYANEQYRQPEKN